MPIASTATLFGRVRTAMVTPFRTDGSPDLDAAVKSACWLADRGNAGLVLKGTAGEAPTTTDAEQSDLVKAVKGAVGDQCLIVAGVGANDTLHTLELAHHAAQVDAGDLGTACRIHQDLVPAVNAVRNITQGAMISKDALAELGVLDHATVRLPLIEVTPQLRDRLRPGLKEPGLL